MALSRRKRTLRQGAIAKRSEPQTDWRNPDPQSRYDAIIIGGGGHGLATAYYLAKVHRLRRAAVLERGWIGEASWALPTVFGRGPDHADAAGLHEHAVSTFDDLAAELGYETGVRRCGVVEVAMDGFGADAMHHAADLVRLAGGTAETLGHDATVGKLPLLATLDSGEERHFEAVYYPNGGLAPSDQLAWAYGRAAEALGIDIVQNCEVTEVLIDGHKATGVMTDRGQIDAPIIAIAAEAYAGDVAAAAGFTLPIRARTIELIATEPYAPILEPAAISRSPDVNLCQMPSGEIVAWNGPGAYASRSPWGSGRQIDALLSETVRLVPGLGGANVTRRWSASIDVTPDCHPLIGRAPIDGIFLNCGWGAGGYAALPASGRLFAELLGRFTVNDLIAPFSPARFASGSLLRPAMIPAELAVVGASCF